MLEVENISAFGKFWVRKETPKFCAIASSVKWPPLLMPAHQHALSTLADTTTIGTALTMVEDPAAKPDDVAIATSDADFFCIVLRNGVVLSAKSAGMDECPFHSHFNKNEQVCCTFSMVSSQTFIWNGLNWK